eukprot:EG_transcript_27747
MHARWHQRGILVYVYLDDIFITAPTTTILTKHLCLVVEDLMASGFRINFKEKSAAALLTGAPFGVSYQFSGGNTATLPSKDKRDQKRTKKVQHKKTRGCHFWEKSYQISWPCPFKGFHIKLQNLF